MDYEVNKILIMENVNNVAILMSNIKDAGWLLEKFVFIIFNFFLLFIY